MTMLDSLFTFLAKALAIPELHAVVVALCAGMACTYVLARWLPTYMNAVKAKLVLSAAVFLLVLAITFMLSPTPHALAWGATVGMIAPALHGALIRLLLHRWPWLAPIAPLAGADAARAREAQSQRGVQNP